MNIQGYPPTVHAGVGVVVGRGEAHGQGDHAWLELRQVRQPKAPSLSLREHVVGASVREIVGWLFAIVVAFARSLWTQYGDRIIAFVCQRWELFCNWLDR